MRLFAFVGILGLAVACVACGGGGDDDPDGGGAGGDCSMGGTASNDRYLPFDVGNHWRYRVTAAGDPSDISTKTQDLTDEGDDLITQTTQKGGGSTVSKLDIVGDAVMRFSQEDYDSTDMLLMTTYYEPDGKARIDEDPARLMMGATWDETYTKRVVPAMGAEIMTTVTDTWTVMGVDVACSSPLGDYSCIHLMRERDNPVIVKEYWYARGIGKVREEGGQIEELLGCNLQ